MQEFDQILIETAVSLCERLVTPPSGRGLVIPVLFTPPSGRGLVIPVFFFFLSSWSLAPDLRSVKTILAGNVRSFSVYSPEFS